MYQSPQKSYDIYDIVSRWRQREDRIQYGVIFILQQAQEKTEKFNSECVKHRPTTKDWKREELNTQR